MKNFMKSTGNPVSYFAKCKMALIFAILVLPGTMFSQLVSWEMAGTNGSSSKTATGVAANMETSGFNVASFGSGLTALNYGAADGLEAKDQTATTLADAITGNDYITFKVKPKSGYSMSLTSIDLRPFSQNRSRSFALLSSVSGFSATQVIGTVDFQGNTGSPNLLNIALAGHTALTGEVEFRIYIYGGTNQYESCGLAGPGDDLVVNGTTQSVVVKYDLAVNSGSGTGKYEAGQTVNIVANTAPEGKQFDAWTGYTSGVANVLASSTTFTMPAANASLTATYKDIPTGTTGELATWDFAGTAGAASKAAGYSATGITASSASLGSGLEAISYGDGHGLTGTRQTMSSLAEAITDGEYISFTITPASGNTVTVSSIKLIPVSQNKSRTFALLSSVNGFSSNQVIGSFQAQANQNAAMQTINISGHANLNSPVEFRIYIYGQTNQYESVGLGRAAGNDLVVEGSVNGGVTPPPTYTLNISASNGSVTKNPNKTSYASGESVSLTASANSGYQFSNWSGDASGNTNPLTITMNSDKSITANFTVLTTDQLEVSTNSLNFNSDAGSQNVSVTSNISWTVTKNQSWISVTPISGTNNANVSISVTSNTGTASRSGKVTIAGAGITRELSIAQSGISTTTWPTVGMGLDGLSYYSSSCYFSNAVKTFRWREVATWDANGYPASANSGTTVEGWAGYDYGRTWPEGDYTLTWEGNGDVTVFDDATLLSENLTGSVKRRVYKIKTASGNNNHAIKIKINSFPATNIHLWLPGEENSTSLWSSAFTAYLEPFRGTVLRFMDLNGTNSSQQKDWADRTPRDWSTYANTNNNSASWSVLGKCSYEAMIELCNQLDCDMWVCIPHLATDDYVKKLAKLIKTGYDGSVKTTDPLKSTLNVWVEYSNENWNSGFGQHTWLKDNTSIPGDNVYKRMGYKASQIVNLFRTEFADNNRVKRILGTQTGYGDAWVTKQQLSMIDNPSTSIDAIGITTYFSLDIENYIYNNWPVTEQQCIDYLTGVMGSGAFYDNEPTHVYNDRVYEQFKCAYDNGNIPLVAYEGNSHMIASRRITLADGSTKYLFDLIPATVNFMHGLERNQKYVDLYKHWLTRYEATSQVFGNSFKTNVPFVLVSQWSKWGQWGHVEHVGQSVNDAKKYKMLLDHYNLPYPNLLKNAELSTLKDHQYTIAKGEIYPNPVIDGSLTIRFDQESNNLLEIYGLDRKLYLKEINNQELITIDISGLNKGMYLIKMNGHSKKVIVQ